MKVGVLLPMGNHGSAPEPWPEVLGFARRAEALELDALWVVDHVLLRFPGAPERGIHEAWSVLAALAAATETIELGTLVLGLRMRNPALLAKMAATTDDISGGRLTLGVGAGWHDPEVHRVRLSARPPSRQDRGGVRAAGAAGEGGPRVRHRAVGRRGGRRHPAAGRPSMRILSAGRGPRMMGMVARFADAANVAWMGRPTDPVLVERMAALDRACEAIGRDPATLERTVGVSVRYPDATVDGPSPDRSKNLDGALDSAQPVADGLRAFADAGYPEVMVWLEPMNIAALDRLAESVGLIR